MSLRTLGVVPALVLACSATAVLGYEVAAVSNGGRVEGKITFLGDVPTRKIGRAHV